MPPTAYGTADFDQPHDSDEITIELVVPEEFAGCSMTELQSRRGLITDMKVQDGSVTVRASLPISEYDELKKVILAATSGLGRVEDADHFSYSSTCSYSFGSACEIESITRR